MVPRFHLRAILLAALFVVTLGMTASSQSVFLDQVDGLYAPDSVRAGETLAFHFRIQTNDSTLWGIANGFRIYSIDGAEWSSVTGLWSEAVSPDMFQFRYVAPLRDGANCDTIGFGGVIGNSGMQGIPTGFDSVTWTINVGPVAAEHEGRTICLDSSFFPPFNEWVWHTEDLYNGKFTPSWGGPYCFTVVDAGCCEIRGDVNHNGIGSEIGDLQQLAAYVTASGPEPPCLTEADVDDDGLVTIADVVYLQMYMFESGPAPAICN